MDEDGTPLKFGGQDYFEIIQPWYTNSVDGMTEAVQRATGAYTRIGIRLPFTEQMLRSHNGPGLPPATSWCLGEYEFWQLVRKGGGDSVHINCKASDLKYVTKFAIGKMTAPEAA